MSTWCSATLFGFPDLGWTGTWFIPSSCFQDSVSFLEGVLAARSVMWGSFGNLLWLELTLSECCLNVVAALRPTCGFGLELCMSELIFSFLVLLTNCVLDGLQRRLLVALRLLAYEA